MNDPSEGALFEAAACLPAGAQRAAFLDQVCLDNPELRERLEALLAAHDGADEPGAGKEGERDDDLTSEKHTCSKCGGQFYSLGGREICPRCILGQQFTGSESADDEAVTLGAHATAEKAGDSIGPYKLLEKIGEGGFGVVYMAEQTRPLRRRVALKVIKMGMDTRQVIARFEAERQALAMMDDPNIAKVLDAGATESGRPYFVMELVKGVPITQFCNERRLDHAQRLDLFLDVCSAVQHAHQKGVIHRDLKPSNVLVTLHGDRAVPKVIDFGIAKATHQPLTDKTLFTRFDQFIGTPVYMSPEQATLSGLDIDTRSDIYALGVLLYELLAGKPPFDVKTLAKAGYDEIRRVIREEEPPRPSLRLSTMAAEERTTVARALGTEPEKIRRILRGDIDWIVMKAIEKDRGRRYETANALAQDIRRHLADEPVNAAAPSVAYKLRKFSRRHKTALAVAATIAFVLVAASLVSSWMAVEAGQARQAEKAQRLAAEQRRSEAESARTQAEEEERRANSEAALAREAEAAARQAQGLTWLERADSLFEEKRYVAGKLLAARTIGFEGFGREAAGRVEPDFSNRLLLPGSAESAAASERLVEHPDDALVFRSPLTAAFGSISAVAWGPDDTRIAVGNQEGEIEIWDANSGAQVNMFQGHGRWVSFVAFTQDGKSLVSASRESGTFRRHDVATGAVIWDYGDRHFFRSGALSPEGKVAVAGDLAGKIVRVDVATGKALPAFQTPTAAFCFAFHPSEPLLASGHQNGELRLWNRETGELLQRVMARRKPVYAAAFTPDGERLLTCGGREDGEEAVVKVWKLENGSTLALESEWGEFVPNRNIQETPPSLICLEARPRGDFVVVGGSDGRLRLRSLPDGNPLGILDGHRGSIQRIDLSPDGRRLVSFSSDGTTRIWDLEARRETTPHSSGEVDLAESVDISPDGRWLATASTDGQVRLRDLSSGRVIRQQTLGGRLRELRFSPDGARFAISDGVAVRVLDTTTLREVGEIPVARVLSLVWSPGGEWLVTSTPRQVRIWDAVRFEEVFAVEGRQACFRPDGTLVTTTRKGSVLWNVEAKRQLGEWPRVLSAYPLAFHPDGDLFVAAGAGGNATVWVAGDPPVKVGTIKNPEGRNITRLAISPDGTLLATAGNHETIRLWSTRTLRPVATLEGCARAVRDIRFAPDGRSIAAASEDGAARIWAIDRSLERDNIDLREINPWCAEFVDRETLVTLGSEGIHLVDRRRGTVVRKLSERVFPSPSLAVSPDGSYLVASGQRDACLIEIDSGREVADFENTSYVPISAAFSADGGLVAITRGTWLDVYDFATKGTISWQRQENMTAVAFDPEGQLYVADRDGMIRVLDVDARTVTTSFRASETSLRQMLLTRDGKALLTADWMGVVRIWDIPSHDLRHEPLASPFRRASIAVDIAGTLLATASPGSVQLWSIASGEELESFRELESGAGPARLRLSFSPDGRLLAAAGRGSAIALYTTGRSVLPAGRFADYLTDFRFDNHRVVPRTADLLTVRPALWNPDLAPSSHLSLLSAGGIGEETDRALFRHYMEAGNIKSAALVLRRLPSASHTDEIRAVLDAISKKIERLGRRKLTEMALRYSDLAVELAPLLSDAAVFEAERDRAVALVRGGRREEALALYHDAIGRAVDGGFRAQAERLAMSRVDLLLEAGDVAAARDEFANLLSLPSYSDPTRRSQALQDYLENVEGALLAKDAAPEFGNALLAVALLQVWEASGRQPVVDFSQIKCLGLLVEDAREGREEVILVPRASEWTYWHVGQGLPPAEWKSVEFEASAWSAGESPLDFSGWAEQANRRHESIVQMARIAFRVEPNSLPPDFGLLLHEDCRPAAVIFLNGQEIYRRGLPSGAIDSDTLSLPLSLGLFSRELVSPALEEALREGENVLAVQMHRPAPGNSSVRIDCEIVATVVPGRYLAVATERLPEIIEGLREVVPQDMWEEKAALLRFAFGTVVDGTGGDGRTAAEWRRRARVQRALGRADAARSSFQAGIDRASAAGNDELATEIAQELTAYLRATKQEAAD